MTFPLFLIVFFLSIHGSTGDQEEPKPKIIVFKGSVDPLENCVKLDLTNTTECAVQCAKNESCLYTHGFDTLIQDPSILGAAMSSLLSSYSLAPKMIEETCPFGRTYLKTCPNGWEIFRRNTIWYCLKVLISDTSVSQKEGTEMCQRETATLSGVETMEETKFVNGEGFLFHDPSLSRYAGYEWLPGQPDNKGGVQDCIVLMVPFGKIDDVTWR